SISFFAVQIMITDDGLLLLACVGGSILSFKVRRFRKRTPDWTPAPEWVPVGTVKHLRLFPVKSCKAQEVFSFLCGPVGGSVGDLHDRGFMAINGQTGLFLTARAFPRMVLIECTAADAVLTVKIPDSRSVNVVLEDVIEANVVRRGTMFLKMNTDGLDCGDGVGALFDEFLGTTDTRLIYYQPHLYQQRVIPAQPNWWNSPVPKRIDTIRYADLSPFMVTTEASQRDLNSRLDTPVSSLQMRGNIVVDHCAAWDEDSWAGIRIGEAELQCYKPCTRCVLSTVGPETGEKDAGMQPLKKLREFRLAPEGRMREAHGQSPIFGVNAGLMRPGYIHVGQTVYVKYKPSAF
ncbi:hypothetical protein PENTCL1PPCAC_15751, partial [Pristionchus entomophagus]